jgi:hypothetical protein
MRVGESVVEVQKALDPQKTRVAGEAQRENRPRAFYFFVLDQPPPSLYQ